MKVTKVTYYRNEAGTLFEKVSPTVALNSEGVQKAVEGEGDAAKKFFVIPIPVAAAK